MKSLHWLDDPGSLLESRLFDHMLQTRFGEDGLPPGGQIGPFRVVDEIGRGGMGVVYRVERADGQFEQTAALKWLADAAVTDERRILFRRERQILADLSHPNIARIIDGGETDDGHLWFAMEYVEGQPIDAHVAEAQLGTRQRVALVLPIIDALELAHARLLIHRDIKPGNVLIGTDGRPWLLDFGIAGLASDTERTIAFTPECASPEQRALEPVGVASDIWQMGQLLERVLHAEPMESIPADLVSILAKAQAERPGDRYPTIAALGADLRNFLQNRPVAAHAGGMGYRLRRLFARHPLSFVGTVVSATTIVLLVAGFTWYAMSERDRLRQAQQESEEINRFIHQDVLLVNDPFLGRNHYASLTDTLVAGVDRIESRFPGRSAVAGELGLALGDALINHGRHDKARVAIDRAIVRLLATKGPYAYSTVRAQLLRADVDMHVGDGVAATARLIAIEIDDAKLGAEARGLRWYRDDSLAWSAYLDDRYDRCHAQYRTMLADTTGISRIALAGALSGDGVCRSYLGDGAGGLASVRRAEAIAIAATGPDSGLVSYTRARAAPALAMLGRREEAHAVLAAEAPRMARLLGPRHGTALTYLRRLGAVELCTGRLDDAVHSLRGAAEGNAATYGDAHPWTLVSRSLHASALLRRRDMAAARRTLIPLEAKLGAIRNRQASIAVARTLAEWRLREGDHARARALLLAARDKARSPGLSVRANLAAIERGIAISTEAPGPGDAAASEAWQKTVDTAFAGNCME